MWKGRVLVQIEVRETDNPIAKVQDINEEIVRKATPHLAQKEYELIAEIGQAICLPDEKKYTVKLIVGGHELQTELPKTSQKGNYNQFNERFEMTQQIGKSSLQLPYQSIEKMGDMFLILMDENNNPVSYYKERISNFQL